MDIQIRQLCQGDAASAQLAPLLVTVVAGGGSVSFMHPLPLEEARHFWDGALASAARGERVILGAMEGERLLATTTVLLSCPPNQPHRAEIAKMMTLPAARRRGLAGQLLRAAEVLAAQRGKTLLMLDTASEGGAARLYEAHGYALAGTVPDFALKPHGGLTGTMFYWKRIGAQGPSA
ncbi:GNAT family N-acetyltransferase [Massilia sp. PAMC28688]|uniref:GNAT family N-acetyltransferase n=1 Tax=Massilia sp. PAMC28688 TaxID=2861283 RepID=UPI001C626E68|nr:GNAT family N-acetyltransferase [Massilia sp. PAMC28688]QYF92172.1 GNAT family N-acetyltransferase [Massilia sp. PAMC28688]